MSVTRRQLSAILGTSLIAAALAPGCKTSHKGTKTMSSIPKGKPGDFDFLEGEWTIQHRRLPQGAKEWDQFAGEATCWTILGGAGSVEELRIPARDFSGMGLRLLNADTQLWHDLWVNAKSGALLAPGTAGGFANGEGIWESEEMDGERPMLVRGIWDEITAKSCRWRQGVSYDKGATWDYNWIMHWTRKA
jgi:hypothetical protein